MGLACTVSRSLKKCFWGTVRKCTEVQSLICTVVLACLLAGENNVKGRLGGGENCVGCTNTNDWIVIMTTNILAASSWKAGNWRGWRGCSTSRMSPQSSISFLNEKNCDLQVLQDFRYISNMKGNYNNTEWVVS